MYQSYSDYSKEMFAQLIKEASRISKQLRYDIQIMDITHLHNVEEWVIERNVELVANYPRNKEEVYDNSVIKFYYELMDKKHKKIFDRFIEMLEDRVMFYKYGNVRSYKSSNYYVEIKGICSFALSCVYLQRLNFDVVEYLSGKQYFEEGARIDFIEAAYYGAAINEDDKILDALSKMIYDNEGLIRFSDNIIRGMLLSDSDKAHDMVMDVLSSATRSEGLRQSIVEAIDFSKLSVYKRFLRHIHDQNLIRFSSVKRAFMCYTGIEGMVDDKKAKILEQGIYSCLVDNQLEMYLQSDSTLDLYIGLYAIATERLESALEYIDKNFLDAKNYKKAVMMLFIRKCNMKIHFEYIVNLLENIDDNKILGIILTTVGDQIIFDSDEQKREFIIKLSERLDMMKKNVGSYGILDEEAKQSVQLDDTINYMIGLCDEIHDCYEYAYKHLNRISYIRKIDDMKHPFVRREVIKLIGSNTENHRRFAFNKITEENITLTPEEYKLLADFMKSKRSDTRKYVATLFQKADTEIVINCSLELVRDKNYQKRSGGLSILVENKERILKHEKYNLVEEAIEELDFDVEFAEEVSILKGKQVQLKEVRAIYDENYEPTLKKITYDKKLIKKYLEPDEKNMLKFIKGVVAIYDSVIGKEVEVKQYNGSIEIEKFGYGYFNSFRLNRPYGSKGDISYVDYFFYEELLQLDTIVQCEEIELFKFYLGLLYRNVMGDEYSVKMNKDMFEKLTAKKYYPKLKVIKKYLNNLDPKKREYYLTSCISTLNMLSYYKKDNGTFVETDYSFFFLNAYAYMTVLDEKVLFNRKNGTGFEKSLIDYTLNENNFRERGELVFQLMMHSDKNNRENYLTFGYEYLFKFVELGYLQSDYIFKEFFDFKEFGDYFKTTNSIRIINHVNDKARRKKASELELEIYNKSISSMLEIELERTEKDTLYSGSINAAKSFYGIEVYLKAIYKMGKMPFLRGYSWVEGGKKNTFSHIIYYCEPLESDTQELFNRLVKEYKISDKKLLEAGMYNLKFIDYITNYLGIKGMKKAAYYFKAHMKDRFDEEDQKMIRRYTDLDFDDLNRGQMDIKWFKESYMELGEKNFSLLYDCSKYITSGGNHKRAQYFADAVLGRLDEEEVLERINDKRNQDMVLAYGLLPLKDKNKDTVRRYKRLQAFIKESKQFGAQRKASELSKANIAIQNLSRIFGYGDVNRFIWAMEIEMASEMSEFFDPREIEEIKVWIDVTKPENPNIAVEKNGKMLKKVPAKYNKNEYVKKLKLVKKELKEQYSRTKKSFETAMIDEVRFRYDELIKLKKHPIISHVIDKVLWSCGKSCGFLSDLECDKLMTLDGEIELSGDDELIITHPVTLLEDKTWPDWQNFIMEQEIQQSFKQVFREVYVMTDEEKINDGFTNRFAGYQVEPKQTYGLLKSRDWVINDYDGFEKINHIHDLRIDLYCYADWYTPARIESPTLEKVFFVDNKTGKTKDMNELSNVIFSEVMRDLDLVVSVAYVGGVDVMMNHSTIEMRTRILEYNLSLFKVTNYRIEKHHIVVQGTYGNYSIHLGSGIISMEGKGMLPVFPVHSQQRGHIFLPFVDEDPKTAEIISKVLMLAKDDKIKDPSVLIHLRG
ncbi:hypothetical protein SH1V18_02640 [Vallitalea longa]|uniref:DUF4132 domain-containing protein n=1 Tax=Vallitalea longa TaxID=2936439 RepID=A0A9W6DEP0_9FIRM|nr:DUF4132 domain-containing protein [Vallitalea longa]GKX27784.1 hypothetical protein SH1V18_02640 [Vallitalea longa]